MLVIFYAVNILLEIVLRNLIRLCAAEYKKKGFNQKHILLGATAGRRKNILTGSWHTRSGGIRSGESWTIM